MTSAAARMRTAPNAKARIVRRVPASAEIDLSQCSGGWRNVSWRNRFGYLPAAMIAGWSYPAAPPAYGPGGARSGAAVYYGHHAEE